ncbi:MAG: hypothetical protein CL872_04635 [Dehalococcoidaceae bacterium]|nr:hypothetical protein [Dehalococcoidaceae bacterium]|tara:strand:- start:8282 stop:9799 length:1518 start_codon:yes stop_codon:yes gene_type:complete
MNFFFKNYVFLFIQKAFFIASFFIVVFNINVLQAEVFSLGEENSWFRIHNVGNKLAQVDITYLDTSGNQVFTDGCDEEYDCKNLLSEKSRTFFQQSEDNLEIGFRGSAFIKSTQPFVTLMGRDAFKNDKFQIAGDTLRLLPNGSTQLLPIIQFNEKYASRISVQNLDKKNFSCMMINLYSKNKQIDMTQYIDSDVAFCPNGGSYIPPHGSILINESILANLESFDGFGIVHGVLTINGFLASEQSFLVSVENREIDGPGLTQYRGIDFDEASTDVVLPIADKNYSENGKIWDVNFRIIGQDPLLRHEVEFLYQGNDNANNYYEFEHKTSFTKMLNCDLRLWNRGSCVPSNIDNIDNFRGTVRIKSDLPIAIVAQLFASNNLLGNYRGLSSEEASRQIFMPVLNKNYGPFGDAIGWNSSFRVFTFDGSDSRIRKYFFSNKGKNISELPMILNREQTFYQQKNSLINNKWVGSGYIVADKPIVAVVYLFNENFEGDNLLMYNAVSLE